MGGRGFVGGIEARGQKRRDSEAAHGTTIRLDNSFCHPSSHTALGLCGVEGFWLVGPARQVIDSLSTRGEDGGREEGSSQLFIV